MNDSKDQVRRSESKLDVLRGRLEAGRAALERGFGLTTEEREKILKDRAKALAQEVTGKESAGKWIWIVEFVLAEEKYGIEPDFVRDVFPVKTLTPLPCTPPFVLGITNMRGEILSVIDLKMFFDLPNEGISDYAKVVALESNSMTFGILADSVLGARPIPLDSIQPVLPTLTEIRGKYLKGVTKNRIAILDGEAILNDETIIINQSVY